MINESDAPKDAEPAQSMWLIEANDPCTKVLEFQCFALDEICRVFAVPAHMLSPEKNWRQQ